MARSAIALPTASAAVLLPPYFSLPESFLSGDDAAASVLPLVVDDLGGNVLVAADDAQPRPLGRAANALAHAKRPALPLLTSCLECSMVVL